MSTPPRDIELLLDHWFELGPSVAPRERVDQALDVAWQTPQARPFPSPRVWLRTPALRIWGIAVLGLLAVLSLAIAGSEDTPTTYTSMRYGYTLDVPGDWTVRPAADDWGVTDPWDEEPVADVFTGTGLRFTAVSLPMALSRDLGRWADVFVPDRPELSEPQKDPRCLDPRGIDAPIPVPAYRGWESARIGGLGAVVRVACGYVDAVVMTGGRAYVLSMSSGRQALADIAAFDRIVGTIRFTSPTPTPAPPTPAPTATVEPTPEPVTEAFTSPRYGYTIRHPASWRIEPAEQAWDGTWRVDGPRTADEFRVPRPMSIVAAELPASASLEAWISEHVRPPSAHVTFSPGHAVCKFGGTMMDFRGSGWREGLIGGRPAWIRAECGTVDGVVAVGDRVFVVRYDSARGLDADEAAFQAIVDRIEFAGAAPVRPLEPDAISTFTSPWYGYAVRVPWRWSFEPATRPLEDLRPPGSLSGDPRRDRFVTGVDAILIASAPVSMGTTARAWVDEHAPRRQVEVGGSPACRRDSRITMDLPEEAWRPTRVAGIDALERDSCYIIDVAVVVSGRAYLISASSSAPAQTPAGSRATLDTLLGAITFTDADGSAAGPDATMTFDSPRYGYRATVPGRWIREPASRSADDLLPRSFGAVSTFDRFVDDSTHIILAVSAPVPAGTTVKAWAEEHAPSRQTLDPGHDAWQCRGLSGGYWMHIPYIGWRSWQVGGHEALVRDSCFFFDVVTIVDDRAYLFVARSQTVIGTSNAAPAYLDAFLATVEFTPGTAIDD